MARGDKKVARSRKPRPMATAKATAESTDKPDPAKVKAKIDSLTKQHGKKPWNVDFDVYLQPPGSNPAAEVKTCLETNSSKRIRFRNRRRPGFVIRFHLHDDLNPGYRFPPDPIDAVWSEKGSNCPETPVWDIFEPLSVDSGQTVLEVFNENPKPAIGKFHYSLRVVRAGSPPLLIDPPGDNMNGQSS